MRRILSFVIAVFATTLLFALFASSPSYAADATWNGESIMYDGHQYLGGADAKAGESHGLAAGTKYYTYVERISEQPLQQKAHVIYFAPGSDPPAADATASYVKYDLSASNVFSNPTDRKTITIDARGDASAASSCAIQGVGWIVCSVSVFLAQGMDFIFEVLRGFVEVQPVTVNDPQSPLFVAWNVMRSIANIAFIIAFLVIIYSQITSAGISNYGLKKLAPRLIVAAILVNLSYYIGAVAIDLSNIIGFSFQQVFIQIRENIFNVTNDTWTADVLSWESITGFVLSGGTGALAAGVGIGSVVLATALNPVGLIFLILPALMGLLIAVLVVLLILAARQAIIIILLIIAPLAFVAYLLPNTEKWFDKWRDLFMTMLIFFPAFSLVFGGSQLAGGLIIQNANSINVMILGMIVQVAPLVITPLLLKLSGSLLGRIAGIVNNPGKGLVDRTRNWTQPHIEARRRATMNNADKWYNVGGKAARAHDYRKRRLDNRIEQGKAQFEEYANKRANSDKRDQRIATGTYLAKQAAEGSQHEFDQAMNELRAGDSSKLTALRGQAAPTIAERAHARITNQSLDDVRMNNNKRYGAFVTNAAQRAAEIDEHTRVVSSATDAAKLIQQKRFAEEINTNVHLQTEAGGIDPNGIIRARAGAEAAITKIEKEALDNSVQLLNAEAMRMKITLKEHSANLVKAEIARKGTQPPQVIQAALEAVAQEGNISLLREARLNTSQIDQDVLTKVFARNSGTMKEKGGFDLQANPALAGATREQMNRSIAATIGDVTGENIPKVKAGFWGEVGGNISKIYTDSIGDKDAMKGLEQTYVTITAALQHEDAAINLGDRLEPTMKIHRELHAHFRNADKDVDYSKFKVN